MLVTAASVCSLGLCQVVLAVSFVLVKGNV